MKQNIIKKLIFWLVAAIVVSICVFTLLVRYNSRLRAEARDTLGDLYMSEMMYQLQQHYETLIDIKSKEVNHIVEWTTAEMRDVPEVLSAAAKSMDFEFVMLYDEAGNMETILGQAAWFRDMEGYVSRVLAGENGVTTGYMTGGGKYVIFGVPARYNMESGQHSVMVMMGLSVNQLYEYINLKEMEQFGDRVHMGIIRTNGSYVLKSKSSSAASFFDRVGQMGSFAGMNQQEGVDYIETAMAQRETFSCMIQEGGETKHVYGAPAGQPEDWYFVITMPEGLSDEIVITQNEATIHGFIAAGVIVLAIFFGIFIAYFRLSMQQLKETEAARAEAEIAKVGAEQANRAKSTFLSSMSHDIRTPMNAIIGFTNMAINENDVDVIQGHLAKIATSSKHLLLLINEVLEMSRIESGRFELNEQPCSLVYIMKELRTLIGRKAEEKGQELQIECKVAEEYVYCDKLRINQILMNLVSNAIKYTSCGGIIKVSLQQGVSADSDYGCYEIVVSDNGIGMSPEFVKRVFEPFERENTSTVSGIEGTGLGLAIVQRIVDIMNGTIEVVSEKNVGSTFTVHMKFRIAPAELCMGNEKLTEMPDSKELQAFFEGRRILLVEDNEFNREITQNILEQAGFVVDKAENGKIAVDKVMQEKAGYYDAVLMDVQMPIMNGYEAAGTIRGLADQRAMTKIIAVTANAFESDRQDALAAGMDDYISKPIEVESLYAILRKIW